MKSKSSTRLRAKVTAQQSPSKGGHAKKPKKLKCEENDLDKQLKAKQGLYEKQQVCSLASTKYKLENQQSNSEDNSLQSSQKKDSRPVYPCVCAKTFIMRKRFQNHLKTAHSYHLMSSLYCEIRDRFEKEYLQLMDHAQEHRNTISLIMLSKDGSYPIPQEFLTLISQETIQKTKKKLRKSHIDLFDFVKHQETQEGSAKTQILSLQFLDSLKQMVIDYISVYERRMKIYLNNASLSNLLRIFLMNLFNVSAKIDPRLRNESIFFFFEKTLKSFETFVDQRYADCFERAQIFYNHIDIKRHEAYSEQQRTWKIDVFIRAFLQQLRNQKASFSCFQPSKFILCAFHEFIISRGL